MSLAEAINSRSVASRVSRLRPTNPIPRIATAFLERTRWWRILVLLAETAKNLSPQTISFIITSRHSNSHTIEDARTVLDLSASPKGEQLEGIANSTETRVKAHQSIDSEPPQTFSAVVDSGFGRSADNRMFLRTLPYTVKAVERLVIRGISGRQTVSELATFVFYMRSNQGAFLKLIELDDPPPVSAP
ncbi:hypothetical protein GJ744_010768 [Endocarpon pusillum]|uniref:Uncharacterized protein n=1 Tax=Endocarpon pusillum TaxID=364733 RepID=A0A8H7ADP2_9EURO|nr:hypothetical protein GJ744_010768 [Endocarpon pusillum]